ncbi:MAG: S8 family serine peptidase [Candidatus Aenigmarchaeota archaeon]|nr:S8 family serine peptidase [Candidatus Aenigmarchaeota archaeon]
MSAPHVSGVVALMLEYNPLLTVDEIKTALYETATHISSNSVCYGEVKRGKRYFIGKVSCSPDNYGAGIVDAYSAVNYIPSIDCYNDTDCNDDNECTKDSCVYSGTTNSYCANVDEPDMTKCTKGICCAGTCCVDVAECIDCCSTCHKSVCDGKCNLAKEDASCPDCQ